MNSFPKTIIIRHRKENLKKCSLKGLETRSDFEFYTYPNQNLPQFSHEYVLLKMDAPELSIEDCNSGLLILDATWRYAAIMERNITFPLNIVFRSLPVSLKTAYPRKQADCPAPGQGLASIEAIAAAYEILERDTSGLLKYYYWKDSFLEKNRSLFIR